MLIGYKLLGEGDQHVLVMHNWFFDSSSFGPLHPYLDKKNFTYAFLDLRGYGSSKHINGTYTVEEASQDALDVADSLDWDTFHIIGHSMGSMIAQRIALDATDRVLSLVGITPAPACGSTIPSDIQKFIRDAANDNDENATQIINSMTGQRHSNTFLKFKVKRWRESSTPEARLGYLDMFTQTDFSSEAQGLKTRMLVLYGEHDGQGYDKKTMEKTFGAWYPHCTIQEVENAGHFPMQETPVYLASVIDRFLKEKV